ncbi:hypothetical protein [Elioraea rosea]|uniref:hypothetical protein n=1 Tax=Elioraea rosea TaxID=2492390 RepID=UPI0011854D62|nr:hypothetical protein [Elioraea rosea]
MRPILPEAWIAADWQPPAIAFAASVAASLLLAALGRRRQAGLAAASGLLVALFLVFGVRMVTPRMLPERLPWLVLAATTLGLAGDMLGLRGAALAAVSGLAAAAGAWFMLGAPRALPDLARIAAEALPVLVAFAVPLWQLVPGRAGLTACASAAAACALLAAGLHLAGSATLFPGLALAAAAAGLGAVLAGAVLAGSGTGLAGSFALASAIAGIAVAAGLAQRAVPVWLASAAPLAGLALAPMAARLLGLGQAHPLGAALAVLGAGSPLVLLAWLGGRGG